MHAKREHSQVLYSRDRHPKKVVIRYPGQIPWFIASVVITRGIIGGGTLVFTMQAGRPLKGLIWLRLRTARQISHYGMYTIYHTVTLRARVKGKGGGVSPAGFGGLTSVSGGNSLDTVTLGFYWFYELLARTGPSYCLCRPLVPILHAGYMFVSDR